MVFLHLLADSHTSFLVWRALCLACCPELGYNGQFFGKGDCDDELDIEVATPALCTDAECTFLPPQLPPNSPFRVVGDRVVEHSPTTLKLPKGGKTQTEERPARPKEKQSTTAVDMKDKAEWDKTSTTTATPKSSHWELLQFLEQLVCTHVCFSTQTHEACYATSFFSSSLFTHISAPPMILELTQHTHFCSLRVGFALSLQPCPM